MLFMLRSEAARRAPELPRMASLVKFRREHRAELATDPAAAAHVTSEIGAIEELRRAAGMSGQSTQRVYVDSRRTVYSRVGDVLPWAPVIFTGAGLFATLFQTTRPAFGRRSCRVSYALRNAAHSDRGDASVKMGPEGFDPREIIVSEPDFAAF